MKMTNRLTYEELSDKVVDLWRRHNMHISKWESELTKLVEECGWTRAEWDAKVSKKHGGTRK